MRGYVLITALIVVMIAMFLSTVGLARLRALAQAGAGLRSHDQEELTARSVTAVLVDQFHTAGRLPQAPPWNTQGQLDGIHYRAELRADADDPELFHLTAEVGRSRFTRVLRQENKKDTVGYARTQQATEEQLLMARFEGTQLEWRPLPEPPSSFFLADSHEPYTGVPNQVITFATAANLEGDLFALRSAMTGSVAAFSFARFRAGQQSWETIPLPDTTNLLSPDVTAAADSDHLYLVKNQPVLLNTAPNPANPNQIRRELYAYSIENRNWLVGTGPPARVYDHDGSLMVDDQGTTSLDQVVARDGKVAVVMHLGNNPSTIALGEAQGQWGFLPPVPRPRATANGLELDPSVPTRVGRLALGSKGRVLASVVTGGQGCVLEFKGGQWNLVNSPPATMTAGVQSFLDAEESLYFYEHAEEAAGQRLWKRTQTDWSELSLPDGTVRELEIGGVPRDDEYVYKTTVRY